MNIYVGNLNYQLTEDELRNVFSAYGEVVSVKLISDKETGRAKGFGFVEMADDASGEAAIKELEGQEVKGRSLRVSKANPPKPRF